MTDRQWAMKLHFKCWEWINLTGHLQIFFKTTSKQKGQWPRTRTDLCSAKQPAEYMFNNWCLSRRVHRYTNPDPPRPQEKCGSKAPNESQSPLSRRHSTNTCIFIQQSAHTQHLLSYTHTCKSTHAKKKKHAHAYRCSHICTGAVGVHILTQTQPSVSGCSHSVSIRHTHTQTRKVQHVQ